MARVALVTGGTKGIGKASALELKDAGYTVAVNYHGDDAAAEAVRDEHDLAIYKWDVSDFGRCAAGVEAIESDIGPVDILINNAGMGHVQFLHKMSADTWHKIIATNLDSCFHMCHAVLPGMRERKFGRIVNISSIGALISDFGQSAYSAAKAGVIALTRTVAYENANLGITVNAIAPGYTATEMLLRGPDDWLKERVEQTPVGRLGEPEDIARAIRFLTADENSFITGAVLPITGGVEIY